MKNLLFIIFIHIGIVCTGQTTLTNGQVYNFDVGDIIQGRYDTPWAGTITYETKTFLNKVYSANNDTIFYTIKLDLYSIITTTTTNTTFNTSTIIDTTTNLNAIAIHNNITSSCITLKDTSYLDFCNKTVWEKRETPSVSCTGQPNIERTSVISGLGGPYYNFSAMNGPVWPHKEFKLIYYMKSSGSCGTLVTSINTNLLAENYLSFFPNPAQNTLQIKSANNEVIKEITVFDVNGKKITTYFNSTILDITDLAKGIYFTRIKTEQGEINKKFVKE